MTDRLWTPWRMQFINSDKSADCIFCTKPAEQRDRDNYILVRGAWSYIILNVYPYTAGHLMVVPYAHENMIEALPSDVSAEMMDLAKEAMTALRQTMHPSGFNLGLNEGASAGAGIADHVHLHVVPRWVGDTNFMPIIGETRLLPELLADTYDKLVEAGLHRG